MWEDGGAAADPAAPEQGPPDDRALPGPPDPPPGRSGTPTARPGAWPSGAATSDTPAGAGLSAGRDVRVTGLGGGVAAGLVHTVHNYQAPPAPVRLPYRIGRVPALARDFLARDLPELAQPAVPGPPLVLAGTAGAGKTQLAAKFAEDAWAGGQLRFLLWVDAGSRDAVLAAYTRAAQDLLGRPFPDPADGAQAFLNWCRPAGGTQPHPWLIVLDGVADPADLMDLWPPASPHSRVLATSIRRDAGAAGEALVVPVRGFTVAEARGYLERALERRGLGSPEDDELARLVERVGDKKDFLTAAAQHVVVQGLPLDRYFDHLGSEGQGGSPTANPLWRSIEAAQHVTPDGLAVPVLRMLALFGGEGVPDDALLTARALEALAEVREHSAGAPHGEVTRNAVRATLKVLHRMSLVDTGRCGRYATVRAETRAGGAALSLLQYDRRRQHVRAAADVLAAAWPETEPDAQAAELFRSAADALDESPLGLIAEERIHPVVFRAGRSLGAWGRPAAAWRHFGRLAAYATWQLDADHPDVLRARSRAARWLGVRGADVEAADELEQVLADQRRVLAADHPDILTTRHCLAWCRLSATSWDAEGPRAELADVLRERIRVLGPDHADTLVSLYTIVYAMLGRTEPTAEGEDVRAAANRLRVPEILSRQEAFGRLDLVTALHGELERIAGPDHPTTLHARRALAVIHLQKDGASAQDLVTRLLDDALSAVGPEHPITLDAQAMAALVTCDRDSSEEAFGTLLTAALDQARVLGRDHPDALRTREISVDVRAKRAPASERGKAPADYAKLLSDVERVFGRDHRRTRQLLRSLADSQALAAQHIAAVITLADLVTRSTRILGPAHRTTLAARSKLGQQRGAAGDDVSAMVCLAETLSEQIRVLPADDPDILTTRRHLAWTRAKAGDQAGGLEEFRRLLAFYERATGSDRAEADLIREALAYWQEQRRT